MPKTNSWVSIAAFGVLAGAVVATGLSRSQQPSAVAAAAPVERPVTAGPGVPRPAAALPTRGNLPAQLEAMQKLEGFLGEWLGDGWFTLDGKRVGIVQSVTVRRELQGQLLTLRDRVQRRTDPISAPGTASFGIVSYDDAAGRFLMRSYFRGQITDLDAQVPRPGVLIGQTTRPNGVLARVTTDVSVDGVWREWSEDSSDAGRTWTKSYEILMKRLPGS
jgi:hypothetical protein